MMTNSWTEVASLAPPYFSNSDWISGKTKSENWSQQENKLFENALAHFDELTPDRWEKVAGVIPGKTVDDVIQHYQVLEEDLSCIEAGLIPFPGYSSSSFTLDWESDDDFDKLKRAYAVGSKRSGTAKLAEHERKKGVPWTEDEHKRFLMGLMKYGKGDWRNISRNFVFTRTPTQVASHAQKYFIRLNSGGKDKRRASIHDITTVSLEEKGSSSPSQLSGVTMQSSSASASCISEQLSMPVNSEPHSEAASVFSPSAIVDQFICSSFGILEHGAKLLPGRNSHHGNLDDHFRQNGLQTIQSLPSLEIKK